MFPAHIVLTQIPDLVARLSGLHATLTMRLTLHESLLALSGRLDMVISQIEMRSSGGPTELPAPRRASKHKRRRNKKYVEGESDEEEEQQQEENIEVEIESGDDGGSVEDVELGGSDEDDEGDSDEDEEDEDDDEDEEDEEDEGGPKLNGFIDDEAEEEYSEEEDDESE